MLTSISVRDTAARIVATGLFLLFQVLTYLLAWIFSLVILPAVYQVLHLEGWLVELSIPLLRLTFFFLVREAVNFALWRTLLRQLKAETFSNVALAGSRV
jgi:hypothetical protein